MNTATEVLAKARRDAQQLNKTVHDTAQKEHAEIRASLRDVALKSKQIGESLKSVLQAERGQTKEHVEAAIERLEGAAKHARTVASASDAELKKQAAVVLDTTRRAVAQLSHAVASQRANTAKVS